MAMAIDDPKYMGEEDKPTVKKVRQRVISIVFLAFWAGTQFERTITHYRERNLDGIEIIMCALFLIFTIFWTLVVWRKIKELEPPVTH